MAKGEKTHSRPFLLCHNTFAGCSAANASITSACGEKILFTKLHRIFLSTFTSQIQDEK